eukprot:Nk52_evm1s1833 gene=Nk52_evmTU1s1833
MWAAVDGVSGRRGVVGGMGTLLRCVLGRGPVGSPRGRMGYVRWCQSSSVGDVSFKGHGDECPSQLAVKNYPLFRRKKREPFELPEEFDASKFTYIGRKKRRMVLAMAYCGHEYSGSQINYGASTVEGEVLKACLLAGLIRPENYHPLKSGLKRCSRTDKGVHSVGGNVFSVKLLEDGQGVEKLNELLPADIRVLAMAKVGRSFNPQWKTFSRSYKYILPTRILHEPSSPSFSIAEAIKGLQAGLDVFKGNNRFHNYTKEVAFGAPQAFRHILDISCGEVFEIDGVEVVEIGITGKSFLYHQIRKMIGMGIIHARGMISLDAIQISLQDVTMSTPLAPAEGLYLHSIEWKGQDHVNVFDGDSQKIIDENTRNFERETLRPVLSSLSDNFRVFDSWMKLQNGVGYEEYSMRPVEEYEAISKKIRERMNEKMSKLREERWATVEGGGSGVNETAEAGKEEEEEEETSR